MCSSDLHAPGRTMIDAGVDDASRSLAQRIRGPACNESFRSIIFAAAGRRGWSISVDAFASSANRLVARYYSEYAEADSEAVDAFAVPDWNSSQCPHCGQAHREVVFAFPPPPLVRHFIAKARADQIRAVVVVPASITAPYWACLLAASLTAGPEPFLKLRDPESLLEHTNDFHSSALALFTVDFDAGPSPGSDSG